MESEKGWLVPLLSIYFASALFGAFFLSGPENAFWYQPLNAQFMVLIFAYAVDRWPMFGTNRDLPKNLLVIILLMAVPPVSTLITESTVPVNVFAFWNTITIPMYISIAFSSRDMSTQAVTTLLSIPLLSTAASYYFYNPLMVAKTMMNQ